LARAVPRDNIRQAPDENTEILMNDLLVNELFDDSGEVWDSGGELSWDYQFAALPIRNRF
jgi:hypothetical protein